MKHLRTVILAAMLLALSAISVFADIAPIPAPGPVSPTADYSVGNISLVIVIAVAALAAALVFVGFKRKDDGK